MNDEDINLKLTMDALTKLGSAVKVFDALILEKKNELAKKDKQYLKQIDDLEKKIEDLRASSENVIDNIDDIINKLERVLENNGADNHNN